MKKTYYAHSLEDDSNPEHWQELETHLRNVAHITADFAEALDSREWGYLAGLWHDLGKYSDEFQRYIRAADGIDAHMEGKTGRVDHSTAGGLNAVHAFNETGRIFAYLIAGHHAGLPDWEADRTGNAALSQRLKNAGLLDAACKGGVPADILNQSLPKERPKAGADPALWIRLLFSCLVDADFLDTEEFYEPDKVALRGNHWEISDLLALFSDYMHKKQATAADTKVNRIRSHVLTQCIEKEAE